jgi:hypothetical protein
MSSTGKAPAIICIPDLHGRMHKVYNLLAALVKELGYDVVWSNDTHIVFLGDFCGTYAHVRWSMRAMELISRSGADRGPDTAAVIDLLCAIKKRRPKTTCLAGEAQNLTYAHRLNGAGQGTTTMPGTSS